jgi:excinuclease UvrABC nuclease subunit
MGHLEARTWTLDPESAIRLEAKAPSAPGVYAFIVDDVVVYVGLTLSGLKTRFNQYRRGNKDRERVPASTDGSPRR